MLVLQVVDKAALGNPDSPSAVAEALAAKIAEEKEKIAKPREDEHKAKCLEQFEVCTFTRHTNSYKQRIYVVCTLFCNIFLL